MPGGLGSYRRESDAPLLSMVQMPAASQASSFSQSKPHILHCFQTNDTRPSFLNDKLAWILWPFHCRIPRVRKLLPPKYLEYRLQGARRGQSLQFRGWGLCSKHMHDTLRAQHSRKLAFQREEIGVSLGGPGFFHFSNLSLRRQCISFFSSPIIWQENIHMMPGLLGLVMFFQERLVYSVTNTAKLQQKTAQAQVIGEI